MSDERVVVTGAAGFIGGAVCAAFAASGRACEAWTRQTHGDLATRSEDDLARALHGAAAVVHLAGRAHARVERAQLQRDNLLVTARLAEAARRARVPRFVHVSSVKVNGESTRPGRPFRPDDVPAPADAYGRSKLAAERALQQVLSAGANQTIATVLRLPLVYGPHAPGNFAALVAAVRARRALPLGAIGNRRHFAGVANVVDAIAAVVDAPRAVAGVHFVADAQSVSTPDIVRAIARAAGVPVRLIAVPVPLLTLGGWLTGHSGTVARLTRSLEVDTASLVAASGWQPRPFHIDAATLA